MTTMHLFGFVSVGRGQGTVMGWDLIVERTTNKALLVRDTESRKTAWLPKSAITDGQLATWAVRKIRDAGFVATAGYGDIV